MRSEAAGRSRYQLLKQHRQFSLEEGDADEKAFNVYDIVQHDDSVDGGGQASKREAVTCNGVEVTGDYVYDVYHLMDRAEVSLDDLLFDAADVDDAFIDLITSSEPLLWSSFSELLDDYRGEVEVDSDSNDEDNWRNYYPDEEEYGSYSHGEDYVGLVSGLKIDGDDGKSSSEDELVHSEKLEQDANMHGASFARFKQRVMKSLCQTEEEDLEWKSDDKESE
jgi:hypothetical protein